MNMLENTLLAILVIIASYLIGSIPFGYLVGRIGRGIDIRDYGSRNIGFTNVLRVIGPTPAVMTIVGDVLKGVGAVLLARFLQLNAFVVVGAGLAAIAGHNWSLYLKFRGGRGVATTAGVVIALTWQIGVGLVLAWVFIVAVTRYVSIASITVVAIYPLLVIYFRKPLPIVIFGLVGAVVVIWRHKENIGRLVRGKEHKLGQRVDKDDRLKTD